MPDIDRRQRLLILSGSFVLAVAAIAFVDPIPQDPSYHAFADTRLCFGVPNFGDSASSIGFAVVGLWGLRSVLGVGSRNIFARRLEAWPYIVFFAGVGLVGLGSAYYHLAPDNDRLFWDRLPMTVAFMALLAAFLADRLDSEQAIRWGLPVLVAAGILSLVYWDWSEAQGRGDLRFYGLVQFYPVVALPLLVRLFPKGRHTAGPYLFWLILWYAVAKALETFDAQVFALLGTAVSGHTLKHLAAAAATAVVVRMLSANRDVTVATRLSPST